MMYVPLSSKIVVKIYSEQVQGWSPSGDLEDGFSSLPCKNNVTEDVGGSPSRHGHVDVTLPYVLVALMTRQRKRSLSRLIFSQRR